MKTTQTDKGTMTMMSVRDNSYRELCRRMLAILALTACVAAAPAFAADLLHNSTDTGSTKWSGSGGWGVTGGKYGKFTCATCHEPDADNLKNIRRTINTMDGSNWPSGSSAVQVVFELQTSMGNDLGGHATSSRICEVCHSQNRFHNFNTANNTEGNNHPTPKQTCTNCHSHNTGFKAACGGCHGNPPTTTNIGGDYGLVGTPRPSNALQPGRAGAHATHTAVPPTGRGMVCDTCHYVNNGGIEMPNQSGTIQIGFYGFAGKVTSGTYIPYTAANRGYRFTSGTVNTIIAPASPAYATANKCSNVYCHGGGSIANGKPALGGGSNQNPRWDDVGQNTCGSCHGTTAANPPLLGSHLTHASAATGYSYTCDTCHPVSGDNSHVVGDVRWTLKTADPKVGASATYRSLASGATGDLAPSAIYGQCSNIACHTNGRGAGGNVANPTWGNTSGFANCVGCHGGAAGSGNSIATDKHGAHINNAVLLGANYGCTDCHAKTVLTDTSVSNRSKHVNQFADYSGVRAGRSSNYSTGNGVCSASYCHTDGKGTQKMTTGAGWKSATVMDCKGCHGSDAAPAFVSGAGEPNYANTGANQPRSNSHQKHVGNSGQAATCVFCHGTTVNSAGTAIVGNHTDSLINVIQGGSKTFTWTPGIKTCATISCHGTGSPSAQWGQTLAVDCSGCHGGNSSAGAVIATGRHTAHINNAGTLGANYGCVDCHALTVSAERTVSAAALHGDGFKQYSGTRAGRNSTYTPGNGVCSATYCHTDGKGTQKITTATGWNSGATLDCKGCHGSDAAPAFTAAAGEPNYANTGANQPRSNSHQKHVGTTGQAATCIFCHGTTVTSTGTVITGNHTDRAINVVQGASKTFSWTVGSKTCATISCHGTGSPSAQWGQTLPADCSGCHGTASSLTTGQHAKHTNQASLLGNNLGCVACHANTVSSNTSVSNATNHGNEFANYSGQYAGKNRAACNASYCHSNGKSGLGSAVSWSSGPALGCNGCHGLTTTSGAPDYVNSGAAGSITSNSHAAHTQNLTWTGAASCEVCHFNAVTSAGTAIQATGQHLNGVLNVNFNTAKAGASAGYDNGTRTCSNITCHGGTSAKWGDVAAGCFGCHGSFLTTGAHTIHVNNFLSLGTVSYGNYSANRSSGTLYRFGCANCHPTDLTKHRNGTIEVTLNKIKIAGGDLNSRNNLVTTDSGGYTKGGATNLTCETAYCHSNGRIAGLVMADYRQTPNWFGGTFGVNRCGACHDNPPQYAGQSHYNPASSIGNDGKSPAREAGHMINLHVRNTYVGNKSNGFLKFSSSGNMAHGNPALASTIACYTCHSGIVSPTQIDTYAMNGTGSDFRCGSCHTASTRTKLQIGSIVDASRHVNGIKNVEFAPINFKTKAQLATAANAQGWTRNGSYKAADSYDSFDLSLSTWNSGTKTCLTACHVMQPGIIWGAQIKCVSCHANQ